MGILYGWLHQLPVIGFNSGKYDLNAIKPMPHFLAAARTEEDDDSEEAEQEEVKDGIGSFLLSNGTTRLCSSPRIN